MKKGFLLLPIIAFIGASYFLRLKSAQQNTSSYTRLLEDKVQTLKIALWDYEFHEYDKKLIEAFCEKYPHVNVETVSSPNVFYASKINAMLAGGEDIDVIYTPTTSLYNNLQINHFLIPLNDLIKRDQIDVEDYRAEMEIENQIYGLPYRNDWFVLYYNKALFDKHNIPYPSNDLTWDEYRQLGKQLTSGEGADKTYGILVNSLSVNQHIWPPIKDGKAFDYIHGDLEILRPGLELFRAIQYEDRSAIDHVTHKSINSDQRIFEKGNTGMYINGTWFINYLINDRKNGLFDFEWGVVKMPHWGQREPISKNMARVSINIKTSKLETAWQFVKFITGSEGAKVLANEAMLSPFKNEEVIKLYRESSGLTGKDLEAINEQNFLIVPPENNNIVNSIKNMIGEEIEKIITNEKSVDEGIRDMEEKRKLILAGTNIIE